MSKNNIYLEIIEKNKSTDSPKLSNINTKNMVNAYVAYMANDRDLKGVLLLNYNLKKLGSKYPFVVLIIEKVSENVKRILKEHHIPVIYCDLRDTLKSFTNNNELIDAIINKHYYGKYLIFALTQFNKIVYLDTDLLLLENIDHLFEYDTTPTERDNQKKSFSRIYMTNDMQASVQSDGQVYVVLTTNAFNSGVIITEPKMEITTVLFRELTNLGLDGFLKINTDQDMLNKISNSGFLECSILPMIYNCSPTVVSDFIRLGMIEKPKVIHFMLKPKPWELIDASVEPIIFSNPTSKHLYSLWNNLYVEMVNKRYFEIQPGSDKYADNYFWGKMTPNGCTIEEKINKI